jgi:hypothetical protein
LGSTEIGELRLEQERALKYWCVILRRGVLTFVVGSFEVDFITDLGVFWRPDEFNTTLFTVF